MASKKHSKWLAKLEKQAVRNLNIMKYTPASDRPECDNASYTLPKCDNVNLENDGFCQMCDKLHWKMVRSIFRCDANVPVYKKGTKEIIGYRMVKQWDVTPPRKVIWGKPRQDAGCSTFGDTGSGMFHNDNVLNNHPVEVPFRIENEPWDAEIIAEVVNKISKNKVT